MSAAADSGCALRLVAPRSQPLTDIVALAKTLLPLESPASVKPFGLFGRLGRALTNK